MPFRKSEPQDRDRFDDHFEKFTGRARTVLMLAQDEARSRGHSHIGTEHLLLGLVHETNGVASKALYSLNVDPARVRDSVERIIGRTDREVRGDVGLTPRAKKVVELAVDEVRRMGHRYVGTEHLLLGIIREGDGIGATVLRESGVTLDQARRAIVQLLSEARVPTADTAAFDATGNATGPKTNVVTCRLDDRTLDAVDALVEAGIRPTRSDAAAWLIATGLEANRALIDRVYATVTEIRRLRLEARALAYDAAPDTATQDVTTLDEPSTTPAEDAGPDDTPGHTP